MRKLGPGSTYTRGWETLSHHLLMLRASVTLNILVALFLGLIIGLSWFHLGLEERAKDHLGTYAKASVSAWISEDKTGEYDIGAGPEILTAAAARDALKARVFGGRTFGFLIRQAGFRVVVSGLAVALLFALFVSRHGSRMAQDRKRRGAEVVEAVAWKKRRVRLTQKLAMLAAIVIASVWFLWSLGPRGRAHFGSYFWSSIYTAAPPIASLSSPDDVSRLAWYAGTDETEEGFRNSEELCSYLRRNVYQGQSLAALLLDWFMKLFASLMPLAGAAILFERWRGKRRLPAIHLGEVELRHGTECYHLLFTGSPGSGKSTAIKDLLDQVRDRGQRAVVFDPSGEYIEPYYRNGKDAILNPLDARSKHWSLWADVRQKADFATIAKSLFPKGGKDPFWVEAGASLFAATAQKLADTKQASNQLMHQLLTTGKIEDLAKFLQGTAASKFLDDRAGAMPANLIATVTAKLPAWEMLKDTTAEGAFSVRKFMEDESSDSWLFLSMRQDQEAVLRPLVSLWCDIAATSLLSLPPDRDRRVWVVLDEVASLQKLPALAPLLERGRKHGAAVVLGLQSMPQLRDVYGRDAAAALASQPQTWLVLRTVEPDTARWLEHALGNAEVDETRESVSVGAESIRDGVSLQQHLQTRSVAMATEIMSLPDLQGYLNVPGDSPVFRVRFQFRNRKKLAPIFVPLGEVKGP